MMPDLHIGQENVTKNGNALGFDLIWYCLIHAVQVISTIAGYCEVIANLQDLRFTAKCLPDVLPFILT